MWYICLHEGGPIKTKIIFWRRHLLKYRLCFLNECSRNASLSVYQLALFWEAAFSFSEIFLKILSMHLTISWWVTCECTCPYCAECSAVFDPNQHDPYAPPSLFTWSHPECIFLFTLWRKFSKGNVLPMWKKWNKKQKTAEALNGIKIDELKNCFEQWKKCLDRCIAWRVLWRCRSLNM